MALQLATLWAHALARVAGVAGGDCALCTAPAADLVCTGCLRSLPPVPPVRDGVSAFGYAYPVDRMVQRFKYAGDLAIGGWLAERLAEAVVERGRPVDVVVPVPITRRRLRERGFNQAAEVGRVVARRVDARWRPTALRRVRETPPQAGLRRRARQANLRGAFRCTRSFRGLRVAIVDDVWTTGSTLREVARVLRRAGAREVQAWTVARTP